MTAALRQKKTQIAFSVISRDIHRVKHPVFDGFYNMKQPIAHGFPVVSSNIFFFNQSIDKYGPVWSYGYANIPTRTLLLFSRADQGKRFWPTTI